MTIDGFLAMVKGELTKNMDKAGMYGASAIRKNLNTAQPYKRYKGTSGVYYKGLEPSLPGQFPKKLSGQLVKSITFKRVDLTLEIGSYLNDPPYPKYLQFGTSVMPARPWLTLTWEQERDRIIRIITEGK